MNTLKNRSRSLAVAVVVLVAASAAAAVAQKQLAARAASAGGRPEIKVTLAGAVARGAERVALDKAGAVHPGDVLDWTINSANEGDGAARQYKTTGQIPSGTSFVRGSASADGGAAVTYSIDNGKTFSPEPQVDERQPDGTVRRAPAPASMYTQVRYEWSDPLAAGASLSASYKVRVR